MIPAGERREPLSALERADLIALSGRENVADVNNLTLRMRGSGRPTMYFRHVLDHIGRAGSDQKFSMDEIKEKRMLLFSGIGNHESFVRQMARSGINVVADMLFPDHYTYVDRDLKRILENAWKAGAEGVLTTEKYYVRLSGNTGLLEMFAGECDLFFAAIKIDIVEGAQNLDMLIDRCLAPMDSR